MRKTIINGGVGSKVICVVTNDELEALPIKGTDNGDGTASLTTDSTMDVLPDTVAGDLAAINSASASIDGKLPALVGGKIPVDASVSIDSIDIGDVDIKEFPAGNLGQQLKAASLSVAPATDIADATYIGDVKFGEELPAGTQLVGKVGIDQTTPGTTNLVNVNGGASQTADIKVTLDSESVAVTGPLTDAQLTTQALAKEATLGSIKTAAEAIAVATPDTAAGDLASMSADLGTIQTDIATVKADIATVASNSEITPATVTGTCTAAYATALSLACAGVRNKTLVIVNTDAALTMMYRIRGFAKSGSSYYNEIQAEATLAASTSQPHVIENSYDVITVEVIDGTGHATYAIDYCGGQ